VDGLGPQPLTGSVAGHQVVAGQGTVAVELLSQLPEGVDVVFVPVGGGALIAGEAEGGAEHSSVQDMRLWLRSPARS